MVEFFSNNSDFRLVLKYLVEVKRYITRQIMRFAYSLAYLLAKIEFGGENICIIQNNYKI